MALYGSFWARGSFGCESPACHIHGATMMVVERGSQRASAIQVVQVTCKNCIPCRTVPKRVCSGLDVFCLNPQPETLKKAIGRRMRDSNICGSLKLTSFSYPRCTSARRRMDAPQRLGRRCTKACGRLCSCLWLWRRSWPWTRRLRGPTPRSFCGRCKRQGRWANGFAHAAKDVVESDLQTELYAWQAKVTSSLKITEKHIREWKAAMFAKMEEFELLHLLPARRDVMVKYRGIDFTSHATTNDASPGVFLQGGRVCCGCSGFQRAVVEACEKPQRVHAQAPSCGISHAGTKKKKGIYFFFPPRTQNFTTQRRMYVETHGSDTSWFEYEENNHGTIMRNNVARRQLLATSERKTLRACWVLHVHVGLRYGWSSEVVIKKEEMGLLKIYPDMLLDLRWLLALHSGRGGGLAARLMGAEVRIDKREEPRAL
eukprot:1073313-Amphidinium_carterae.2